MSRAWVGTVCDHAGMATSTADHDAPSPARTDGPGDDDPSAGTFGDTFGGGRPVDPDDTTVAASRLESFRRYCYWSVVGAVGVFLLLPAVTGPVPYPPDPVGSLSWLAVATVIATVVPLIGDRITPSPGRRRRSSGWHRLMLALGGSASVVLAFTWLWSGTDLFWAFPPALVASVAIAPLPRSRRRLAVAAVMLVAVGVGVAVGFAVAGGLVPGVDDVGLAAVSSVYVTPFALVLTLATSWTWDVALQLDQARRQAATLAVSNERLRFAADLHDIQGHHLQVIALKSELAGRLLRQDPDTAQREVAEIRQLAADALSDTRALVQGYRRTSLGVEIGNASSVLRSAGIDARLRVDPDVDVDGLPEELRHVLGLVVREAVTNVIRHSDATRADIELGFADGLRLTIVNDGVTGQPDRADGGLHDLADRVRRAGGVLRWQRDGAAFRVAATLPEEGP
jgi:two-component system, NarL family, sensor histidine kinase DesK